MNLLALLIPSIRELRAALLAGYLWLAVSWLALGSHMPELAEAEPSTALGQVARLSDVVGALGVVVVLSVAAYLLGSFIVDLSDFLLSRIGLQPQMDRVRALGEAASGVSELIERTERMHAEGQVRVHAAAPVLVGAFVVGADHDVVHGVVGAATALALAAHGVVLWRRTNRLGDAVRLAVHRQWEHMGDLEQRERQANLSAVASNEQIRLENIGPAEAHNVTIVTEEGEVPRFVLADTLPVTSIEPGAEAVVPIGLSLADGQTARVLLRWVDGSGERERRQELRFT